MKCENTKKNLENKKCEQKPFQSRKYGQQSMEKYVKYKINICRRKFVCLNIYSYAEKKTKTQYANIKVITIYINTELSWRASLQQTEKSSITTLTPSIGWMQINVHYLTLLAL